MRLVSRLSVMALSLGALAACSSKDSTTPPTQTISVSASPSSATAARGATATIPITLTRTGSYTGTVSLSATGLPTGVNRILFAGNVDRKCSHFDAHFECRFDGSRRHEHDHHQCEWKWRNESNGHRVPYCSLSGHNAYDRLFHGNDRTGGDEQHSRYDHTHQRFHRSNHVDG